MQKFLDFIDGSPTAFHAAYNVIKSLEANGFAKLSEDKRWMLKPGQGYYVSRNMSSAIAFRLAEKKDLPFRIVAVHLDSPALRLKIDGISRFGEQSFMPIEVYGGAILNTWLDRPLGIAGRVVVFHPGTGVDKQKLINLPGMAVIPNLAIHFNRDVNDGVKLNPQLDMAAALGNADLESLMESMDLNHPDRGCFDLFFYDDSPARLCGFNKELIVAPRLDNLASAYVAMESLEDGCNKKLNQVAFFADNEEIGSKTPQGADSNFLRDMLARIVLATGGTQEDFHVAMASSMLLSADAAHAVHPCHPGKHDPNYAPQLNNGVAIKYNVSGRYCTSSLPAAKFIAKCNGRNIYPQTFINRADMPCGSTVGPALAASLGIPGLDIGIPLWAMHSIRETAGVNDMDGMAKAMKIFLNEI